jgi:signal transduction histidine kinase/ActR/RegA family two-component response regulator
MDQPRADAERRVLIFAPVGRDGTLTRELLARAGIVGHVCASIAEVCAELPRGAGAVILTEEALDERDFQCLPELLERQPPWSDLPIVLFAGSAEHAASLRALGVVEALRNVTFIERPIRVAAVISVLRAAIRARVRQYEMRDTLAALQVARTEAETASRLKDEFLATLSHELRTPLNAILGWTTMLRHGQVEPGRVAKALDVVDRNARAQAQLIEDVLDMARIITAKLRLEMRAVALGPIVEAAMEAVRPAAEAKGVTLAAVAGAVPAILGDGARLQQVFWNLLSNAVKFTPPGGEVRVTLGLVDSHAVVTVSDTGAGLAPEFLPFVFDRFRQADQSATRGHGGLGLGLSIVKHLLELHGGTVRAESAGIGRGATFSVLLPVPAMLEPPPDRRDGEPRQGAAFDVRLDGRSVLVVDDDGATRDLLSGLIGRTGAVVATAGSAAEALEQIKHRAPELIVADIGLPGQDGCALMRQVRELPPPVGRVPAIALSAYTRAEDRESAREAGFTTFIAKPATPQELLRALDALANSTAHPGQRQ